MAYPLAPQITDLEKGGQYFQAPIYDPESQQRFTDMAVLGGERVKNPTQGFSPIAQDATRQFYQEIVPTFAQRFQGNFPAQKAALSRAGANLSSNLAAQQAQYGLQQQALGLNQFNAGQNQQYSQAYYQPQDNQLGAQLGDILGNLGQSYLKAEGATPLDKLKATLGIGSAAVDTIKSATGKATTTPTSDTTTDLIKTAAPVVAGQVAKKVIPAATSAAQPTADAISKVATTNPALASTMAGKATSAAKTAGKALGWEAAIAPALAAGGAVAMPIAVAGLFGWWLYKLIND